MFWPRMTRRGETSTLSVDGDALLCDGTRRPQRGAWWAWLALELELERRLADGWVFTGPELHYTDGVVERRVELPLGGRLVVDGQPGQHHDWFDALTAFDALHRAWFAAGLRLVLPDPGETAPPPGLTRVEQAGRVRWIDPIGCHHGPERRPSGWRGYQINDQAIGASVTPTPDGAELEVYLPDGRSVRVVFSPHPTRVYTFTPAGHHATLFVDQQMLTFTAAPMSLWPRYRFDAQCRVEVLWRAPDGLNQAFELNLPRAAVQVSIDGDHVTVDGLNGRTQLVGPQTLTWKIGSEAVSAQIGPFTTLTLTRRTGAEQHTGTPEELCARLAALEASGSLTLPPLRYRWPDGRITELEPPVQHPHVLAAGFVRAHTRALALGATQVDERAITTRYLAEGSASYSHLRTMPRPVVFAREGEEYRLGRDKPLLRRRFSGDRLVSLASTAASWEFDPETGDVLRATLGGEEIPLPGPTPATPGVAVGYVLPRAALTDAAWRLLSRAFDGLEATSGEVLLGVTLSEDKPRARAAALAEVAPLGPRLPGAPAPAVWHTDRDGFTLHASFEPKKPKKATAPPLAEPVPLGPRDGWSDEPDCVLLAGFLVDTDADLPAVLDRLTLGPRTLVGQVLYRGGSRTPDRITSHVEALAALKPLGKRLPGRPAPALYLAALGRCAARLMTGEEVTSGEGVFGTDGRVQERAHTGVHGETLAAAAWDGDRLVCLPKPPKALWLLYAYDSCWWDRAPEAEPTSAPGELPWLPAHLVRNLTWLQVPPALAQQELAGEPSSAFDLLIGGWRWAVTPETLRVLPRMVAAGLDPNRADVDGAWRHPIAQLSAVNQRIRGWLPLLRALRAVGADPNLPVGRSSGAALLQALKPEASGELLAALCEPPGPALDLAQLPPELAALAAGWKTQ